MSKQHYDYKNILFSVLHSTVCYQYIVSTTNLNSCSYHRPTIGFDCRKIPGNMLLSMLNVSTDSS